jgi:hypothetical protein
MTQRRTERSSARTELMYNNVFRRVFDDGLFFSGVRPEVREKKGTDALETKIGHTATSMVTTIYGTSP